MNLSQAIDTFLTSVRAEGRSPRTVEFYARSLGAFSEFVGRERALESIVLDDLQAFVMSLRERRTRWGSKHPRIGIQQGGLSPFSVQAFVRSIKRFFNFCVEREFIKPSQNPAIRLKRQRLPRTVPKEISDDDLTALLKAVGRSKFPERDYAILLFLAGTGCRVGGLVGLRLTDLDLERGRAIVTEKGGKSRRVFLDKVLIDALKKWLAVRQGDCDYVFVNKRGKPCTVQTIELIIKRLARVAGVKGVCNPHAFRHRYAKRYLMNGGDLASLSRLLGHYDVSITSQYYTIFSDEELQAKQLQHSPLRGIVGRSVRAG